MPTFDLPMSPVPTFDFETFTPPSSPGLSSLYRVDDHGDDDEEKIRSLRCSDDWSDSPPLTPPSSVSSVSSASSVSSPWKRATSDPEPRADLDAPIQEQIQAFLEDIEKYSHERMIAFMHLQRQVVIETAKSAKVRVRSVRDGWRDCVDLALLRARSGTFEDSDDELSVSVERERDRVSPPKKRKKKATKRQMKLSKNV